jgi:hypothetical protein
MHVKAAQLRLGLLHNPVPNWTETHKWLKDKTCGHNIIVSSLYIFRGVNTWNENCNAISTPREESRNLSTASWGTVPTTQHWKD